MPRVLGLIPARSGSKGVVDKNLREIGGKSLLNWTINLSLASELISQTIVSTDSEKYALLAKSYGAEVPFLRPPHLATDMSSDIDFILHAIECLSQVGQRPDYIVHLRPTTPFRNPRIVDAAISFFLDNNEKFTSVRSIQEMSESAYKTFEVDADGLLLTVFSRNHNIEGSNESRHFFPATYFPNGYVDILSTRHIESTRQIHGSRVGAFLTERVTEVDSEEDLLRLNFDLGLNPSVYKTLFGDS